MGSGWAQAHPIDRLGVQSGLLWSVHQWLGRRGFYEEGREHRLWLLLGGPFGLFTWRLQWFDVGSDRVDFANNRGLPPPLSGGI